MWHVCMCLCVQQPLWQALWQATRIYDKQTYVRVCMWHFVAHTSTLYAHIRLCIGVQQRRK